MTQFEEYHAILAAKARIMAEYHDLMTVGKYGVIVDTRELAARIRAIPNGIRALASMVHESAWDGRLRRDVTEWAARQDPFIPDREKSQCIGHDPIHLAVLDCIAAEMLH